MTLNIIAALSTNLVIGHNGKLPWHIPNDLVNFKALTFGHIVIMGRKTWESLPSGMRPLKGRTNIVVTRKMGYVADEAIVVSSFEKALAACAPSKNVFVIGGSELYTAAIPVASRLYLTEIQAEVEGDVWFPKFDRSLWLREAGETLINNDGLSYQFCIYSRK
ncbi:dihydrofolate reductase [Methylobacter sp. YRD-M1]|uniref:dihydrofolate reductase n=1 Tax=Methylobacter sp. YRD-M1 TaxID=2911520 RepID=UPI00227B3530|nr:dihydrofolate reductase [Methylobacter sp. YRD-M1]WAK04266.1 dihydrofolate reductase [Methylobacter sp. YRD-M1]